MRKSAYVVAGDLALTMITRLGYVRFNRIRRSHIVVCEKERSLWRPGQKHEDWW